MDIDLKNINMSDIKDQITKLADKKTLIKIGIISGAIIFFLNNLLCNSKSNGYF
jgi:hypoxanthine-guanine phosphoribosyltransferase